MWLGAPGLTGLERVISEPPAIALGEDAKLRRRGVRRQPELAKTAAGSVAKSNNFVTPAIDPESAKPETTPKGGCQKVVNRG